MSVTYVDVEEAIARDGLRMVVVGDIPSPWGEAAKGIFHVKGIDWVAVRLAYDSDALKQWAGGRNGPVAIYGKEPPRDRWNDILLLAERLAPSPTLLPADPEDRALVLGLSHEICGEEGLGWSRRNQLVEAGLAGDGGFPERIAAYLGRKYGHRAGTGEVTTRRVAGLLGLFAGRLKAQARGGCDYLVGSALSAADIYLATAMAMFDPLPPEVCAMNGAMRAAMMTRDAETGGALDPILLRHRDMMYERHLELPLSL